VDRAFQKKTNELMQKHIGAEQLVNVAEFVRIDENTIDLIKRQNRALQSDTRYSSAIRHETRAKFAGNAKCRAAKGDANAGAGRSYGS
jgi:hypothetical protein